jgi:CubicO group peptidase (beta-lactamase class C family)
MPNICGSISIALLLLATLPVHAQQLPLFSAEGPDAAAYGAAEHFPIGSSSTQFDKKYMVGAFSHLDTLYPSHTLAPSTHPWEFHRLPTSPEITYVQAGTRFSLSDYLSRMPVTGLLIAKDDQILYEGYQYARTDRDRFTSQSMAKSIVAMLMGVALSENAIASPADTAAKYVPELKDSAYGGITIRDLLHMSSGMSCQEQDSDVGTIDTLSLARNCKPAAPAGTRFQYSATDSQLLGIILKRAVQMPLAHYLQERIWQNIGTEANAKWVTDASGQELAFCCFNAVLRDYARFARLLAFDGLWNGKQLIPRQWLLDATTVKDSDSQLAPGKPAPFFGYGYQLWILPGTRRMFALLGSNGQRIFVDPQSKLIMVQTAVMEKSIDREKDAETIRLWLSLVRHFGNT